MNDHKLETRMQVMDEDLFDQLRALLRRCGYHLEQVHIDKSGGRDKLLMITELFYDKRSHRLQPKKRNVLRSSVLNSKLAEPQKHGISSTDVHAIDEIQRNSEAGIDLSIHYNKNIGRLSTGFEKQDRLFNDWNILHFHLGIQRKQPKSGFMDRTKNVLMVYPTDDQENLLFLDVRSHDPNDPEPWFDKSYIETLHAEWPGFIAHYAEKRVLGVSPQSTESTVKVFRGEDETQKQAAKQNNQPYTTAFIHFVQMDDGTVYHPLGSGLATNGMRTSVVHQSLRFLQQISDLVNVYDEDYVRGAVYRTKKMIVTHPSVRLRIIGKTLWDCKAEIFESKSGVILADGPF